MHEAQLARRILDVLLERVGTTSNVKIRRVLGWLAETETISSESLGFHFAAHARGTAAEGASLELRLVHVRARCRACAVTYAPEHHLLLCPACGSAEGELLGSTGLGIESLQID